ncbi:MAG: metalloregulator ArsR/SmtB family transcription factor [Pseudomonadota bacterium]
MNQQAEAFNAVAEPSRRALLELLLEGEVPVGDLASKSGMSQPVVSKHLRTLRDAGLVSVRPEGQRRLYRLEAQPLKALDDWLLPYRRFWSERLDALEAQLERRYGEKTADREPPA